MATANVQAGQSIKQLGRARVGDSSSSLLASPPVLAQAPRAGRDCDNIHKPSKVRSSFAPANRFLAATRLCAQASLGQGQNEYVTSAFHEFAPLSTRRLAFKPETGSPAFGIELSLDLLWVCDILVQAYVLNVLRIFWRSQNVFRAFYDIALNFPFAWVRCKKQAYFSSAITHHWCFSSMRRASQHTR